MTANYGGPRYTIPPLLGLPNLFTPEWYKAIVLIAQNSAGSVVNAVAPPVALGFDDANESEPVIVPGPPGPMGFTGPIGPPGATGPVLVLDVPEPDEPLVRPGLVVPGGWYDEKGSGGTYGFAAGVDFTGGTTTSLTLSQGYGSAANLIVAFDAGWQGADQFSLSGRTLTFTSAIPSGIQKVYVKGFIMPQ